MQKPNSEIYRERATSAWTAAEAAEAMGHLEIAQAYNEIARMWLKLAQQQDTVND